jgi:hypothetical protein
VSIKKITPQDFGKKHAAMMERVLAPAAQKLGAKSLTDDVHLEIAYAKKEGEVGLVYDNLSDVEKEKPGRAKFKLQEAYDVDARIVADAAAQAAKTTGGVLTPESARFLPHNLRDDFEHLTGAKIEDKNGVAVPGVSIAKKPGGVVDVTVDFKQALAGVTAKHVVLAIDDLFVLTASRLDTPARADIPPYWLVIGPREGKMKEGTWLKDEHGMRGFESGDPHHLVRAGGDVSELVQEKRGKRETYATLNFHIDVVNDLGDGPPKEASAATKAVREGWTAHGGASIDFAAAAKKGSIGEVLYADVKGLPGIKVMLSAIRDDLGGNITNLLKKGELKFYRDAATSSLAVVHPAQDGKAYAAIYDEGRKKWVGTLHQDATTPSWTER